MLDKHISKTFSESFDDNDEEVVVVDAEDHHRRRSIKTHHHHQLPNVQLLVETNHVPRTGTPFFFETIIQRDPKTKQKFILSLQTTYNGTFPIYCAEKASTGGDRDGGSSSYNLRSMVKKNQCDNNDPGGGPHYSNTILGTVMKQQQQKRKKKNNDSSSTVTYEVIHHDRTGQQDPSSSTSSTNTVMAVIDYEYIHKVQHFIKGGRPRYAQIKIMGREEDDDVESKEPNQDATGQRSLDFNGRGGTNAMVSTKNMQLVNNNNTNGNGNGNGSNGSNGNGKVVLQIIKWNENEFHLDFSYPFDAFHAFAFALAQFDFKSH